MTKSIFICLFPYLLLLGFLSGCTIKHEDIKTAEEVFETSPDSALNILQHFSTQNYKSESTRALYNLLFVALLDKKMLLLKPDTLLDFSVEYYSKHQDYVHLSLCYLYKVRMNKYVFQNEKAMDYYLKSLEIAQLIKDNLLLAKINSDIGDIYNYQNDYGLSRQKYLLAYRYFRRTKFRDHAFYSLLNIGRTYYEMCDYKNAGLYYDQIRTLADDSMQLGTLYQAIGLNYYKLHKYDSALFYFRQVIHYPFIGNNLSIRYYFLADLYFELNQVDSASYYVKNAIHLKPDIRTQRECYQIIVNIVSLTGNLIDLKKYMINYQDCTDSIRKIDIQTRGCILESMHDKNKKVEMNQTKLGYLFSFFFVFITLCVQIYLRFIKRNEVVNLLAKSSHKIQKVNIRKEVILKYSDALLQKIENIKEKHAKDRKNASHDAKIKMDRKIYEEILHLNDIDFFYLEMDIVLNNLVTKLRTRYPTITSKEIIWCCLHLLNIPVIDIYLLLNYKVDSLKKMRQRLTHKIMLSSVTKIDDFLNEILIE